MSLVRYSYFSARRTLKLAEENIGKMQRTKFIKAEKTARIHRPK